MPFDSTFYLWILVVYLKDPTPLQPNHWIVAIEHEPAGASRHHGPHHKSQRSVIISLSPTIVEGEESSKKLDTSNIQQPDHDFGQAAECNPAAASPEIWPRSNVSERRSP
jgi:hypothetical protein